MKKTFFPRGENTLSRRLRINEVYFHRKKVTNKDGKTMKKKKNVMEELGNFDGRNLARDVCYF